MANPDARPPRRPAVVRAHQQFARRLAEDVIVSRSITILSFFRRHRQRREELIALKQYRRAKGAGAETDHLISNGGMIRVAGGVEGGVVAVIESGAVVGSAEDDDA